MVKIQKRTDKFYKDRDGVRARKTAVEGKNENGG